VVFRLSCGAGKLGLPTKRATMLPALRPWGCIGRIAPGAGGSRPATPPGSGCEHYRYCHRGLRYILIRYPGILLVENIFPVIGPPGRLFANFRHLHLRFCRGVDLHFDFGTARCRAAPCTGDDAKRCRELLDRPVEPELRVQLFLGGGSQGVGTGYRDCTQTNKKGPPAGPDGSFLRAIKRFSSVRGRHGAPCTDAARGHYRYLSPGNAPLSMWSCHRVRGRFSLTRPPGASWRSEPSQGWSAARPRPTAHVRSHSLPPATLRTKPSI
jgi:hypothetical protein